MQWKKWGIDGFLGEEELDFLMSLAKHAPEGYVVELGTFRGLGTAALCNVVDDKKVVSIDSYETNRYGESGLGISRSNLESIGFSPHLIKSDSSVVPSFIDRVALLFIDSEHTESRATKELDAWLPFLAKDGIVVLHDYDNNHAELKAFINGFFKDWRKIGLVEWLIAFDRRNQWIK